MRGFFSRRQPELRRILLIESGGRNLLNDYLPQLVRVHGGAVSTDLLTCFAGLPEGFQESTGAVFRVSDYRSPEARSALVAEFRANRYDALGMICSGEPIMTKWKWMLALRLPVKVFVLNENGDMFWLDFAHWPILRHFILFRAGLTGAGAVPTLVRLLLLPLSLAYLVGYAAWQHLKRRIHLRTVGRNPA